MMRIGLFLVTNLAVLVVMSVAFSLLGFQGFLDEQGVNLDLRSLLVFAGLIGFGGSLISLALSKSGALRATGAHVIASPSSQVEAWLVDTVAEQAAHAGIGTPDVAVYDSPDMNAFATGMNRNDALVAVSTGLLRGMRREEVEAVLAHEVSHVANGDMVTLALVQGVVNTFVIFASRVVGHLVDRLVFRVERGHGPGFWVTAIAAELVLGILASVIVMWFSRWREFRADAGGARLAGKHAMIAALERLSGTVDQPHLPDQLAAFGISGRFGGGIAALLRSHPPLEERIAALRAAG